MFGRRRHIPLKSNGHVSSKNATRIERRAESRRIVCDSGAGLKLRQHNRKLSAFSVSGCDDFVGESVQRAVGREGTAHDYRLVVQLAKTNSV
jgi:hypothetical protein